MEIKVISKNISSPGPSVSSGALFNSYTKCGVIMCQIWLLLPRFLARSLLAVSA